MRKSKMLMRVVLTQVACASLLVVTASRAYASDIINGLPLGEGNAHRYKVSMRGMGSVVGGNHVWAVMTLSLWKTKDGVAVVKVSDHHVSLMTEEGPNREREREVEEGTETTVFDIDIDEDRQPRVLLRSREGASTLVHGMADDLNKGAIQLLLPELPADFVATQDFRWGTPYKDEPGGFSSKVANDHWRVIKVLPEHPSRRVVVLESDARDEYIPDKASPAQLSTNPNPRYAELTRRVYYDVHAKKVRHARYTYRLGRSIDPETGIAENYRTWTWIIDEIPN